MRKIFKVFLLILLFIGSFWAIRYLIATNKKENIIYTTTTALKRILVKR